MKQKNWSISLLLFQFIEIEDSRQTGVYCLFYTFVVFRSRHRRRRRCQFCLLQCFVFKVPKSNPFSAHSRFNL